MKRLFLSITIILSSLFCMQTVFAQQDGLRERIARRQAQQNRQSVPQLSVRAANMNESQTQNVENAPWMREVYRFLDMEKEKNASLYYPETPIGDRMNLFTMMFKLLATGDVKAYEYLVDGKEVFTDEYELKFKDMLDRFGIMYTEEGGTFQVHESDIPSNEVLGYYVKEAWYFDKSNSVVDVKTLAICPIVFRQDDFGAETTRYPLFWMPYEEIRPYAARMPIMTSNLNNAANQTIDDFFRKHTFDGEIYKTTNMRNLTLAQMYPVDSIRKKEEQRVETQLKDFQDRLWVTNDSISLAANTKRSGKKSKDYKVEVRTNETKEEKEQRERKEQMSKSSSSSSSSSKQPKRSMRNRRTR